MRFTGEQVRLVTLLTKTVTYSASNQPLDSWAADTSKFAEGKFYAEWWDQGGKEGIEGGQMVVVKDVRCKCRYITGLNERDYRIRKDSKDYDIENIKELGRKEGQILMLKIADNV